MLRVNNKKLKLMVIFFCFFESLYILNATHKYNFRREEK